MSKEKKSKLDQFAVQLLAMDDEKKTIAEMIAWLKMEGVTASAGLLGGDDGYLAKLRSQRLQSRLLSQIATGARQCQEVEQEFSRNAAPELETLIKLHRVLILQLTTQGNANPEFLKLADQLMRTAMEFVSGQTKAAHKERELKVSEGKFQQATCEFFLQWFNDAKARDIANSTGSNAEKIAQLRQAYFKDVDALQASGKVKLPE